MLKLLERRIATLHERLLVLAPSQVPHTKAGACFQHVVAHSGERARLLADVQRLRGSVYLQDGALRSHQLWSDGRHRTHDDEQNWHLLHLDRAGRVSACVWLRDLGRSPALADMRVWATPLARAAHERGQLIAAVTQELEKALREGLRWAEVGGWAVAGERRRSCEGLLLALGAYSLGRLLGGALGLTTATVRHASSSILRRLGGSSLEANGIAIPSYYDPRFRCVMEVLRFDSREPHPRYAALVDRVCERLIEVPVLACHELACESTSDTLAIA